MSRKYNSSWTRTNHMNFAVHIPPSSQKSDVFGFESLRYLSWECYSWSVVNTAQAHHSSAKDGRVWAQNVLSHGSELWPKWLWENEASVEREVERDSEKGTSIILLPVIPEYTLLLCGTQFISISFILPFFLTGYNILYWWYMTR